MTIPSSLYLHGIKTTVHLDPALTQTNDNVGEARYRSDTIHLQSPGSQWLLGRDRLEQIYCHELIHFILHHMHSKLRDDETFVDQFANLLHQALNSSEGDLQ